MIQLTIVVKEIIFHITSHPILPSALRFFTQEEPKPNIFIYWVSPMLVNILIKGIYHLGSDKQFELIQKSPHYF